MITTKDARFNLTKKIFNSWEEKMLMEGDYDLNLSPSYNDSLKEVLRQTMLNQEVVFKKQVNELHRLYTIQKILMKDFGWRNNLGKASPQSTLGPFASPIRCEPLATERTFSTVPLVGSTQYVNSNCLQERGGICYRPQQRPLDLQPPSGHYPTYTGGDLLKTQNNWDSPGKSVEIRNYFCGDNVSCPEEVKLYLSTGGDIRKKGVGKRTWNYITYSSSQHIIDLEESTETLSNEDAEPVLSISCASSITAGDKRDAQVPAQSSRNFTDSPTRSPFHGTTLTDSLVDRSKICTEQNSFNQGFNECHDDLPCNNMFTKGKLFTSYEAVHLDLNKVQPDESSFHSNDPMVAYPSTGSSSRVFDGLTGKFHGGACSPAISWREPNTNHSNETSGFLGQHAVNQASEDSNTNNNSRNISAITATFREASGGQACPIDLESMSVPPSDLIEDPANRTRNSEHEYVNLPLNFGNGNHTDIAMPEVNGEKGKEDVAFSHPYKSQDAVQDTNSRSPDSSKFGSSADDNSSSIKTMQSGTDLGESNLSPSTMFQNFESSQVTETPRQQDLRSSDNGELKHQCCDKKEGESAEMDVMVQKAAISLIYISLESPISNQDCITKAGSNEIENERRERPQYSSDSYESLVVKLTESSVDDYCVSSKLFELNEMDKKDCGIKLRRGSRLKDFQKDILPALTSLSRQEICEDINIMDGVIRSREYKKLRSRMANVDNWFTPVRSRRSRLNYVGRRYYS